MKKRRHNRVLSWERWSARDVVAWWQGVTAAKKTSNRNRRQGEEHEDARVQSTLAGWAVNPEGRLGSCGEKGAEEGGTESKDGRCPPAGRGRRGCEGRKTKKREKKKKKTEKKKKGQINLSDQAERSGNREQN